MSVFSRNSVHWLAIIAFWAGACFGSLAATPFGFVSVTASGGQVSLSFSSQPGDIYRVEYENDLNDQIWTPLASPIIAASLVTMVIDSLAVNPHRFYNNDQILTWGQAGSDMLSPGQGPITRNTTGSPFTITFVGELPQGTLSNPIPAGYSLKASMVPQSGELSSLLTFPAESGHSIWQFSGSSFVNSFFDGMDWIPSEPVIGAGEAFWLNTPLSTNWVRIFTVN